MKYFYLIILFFSTTALFAQQKSVVREIDHSNCREGESVEYCGTHKRMKELQQKLPQNEKSNLDKILLEEALEKIKNGSIEKGVVYKIPVVFHILHNNGIENISREQILDAIEIINTDFRKLNSDANNVASAFQGFAADSEIELVLATKAPNGACFGGITRTVSQLTYDGSEGAAQVDAIVNGNDVYNGDWPGNKYLNIYVCAEVHGAAGYTYRPTGNFGASMYAGIWVLNNYVGSVGTSSATTSRALTHELGHWLGLHHTWGPNNNPGNSASCSDDDGVADTPLTIGVTSCVLNSNTCDDTNPSGGTSSSWNYNVVDNVENYMDYSYCSKMFTQGQANLMRAILNSSTSGRSHLWKNSNLNATGTTGSGSLCAADFIISNDKVCSGELIQFTDESFNNVTSWSWSFPGGNPSSSIQQNPQVTYTSPGKYSVTLTAYSGGSSLSSTKTNAITVLPSAATLPLIESFENYTSLANSGKWFVNDEAGSRAFEIYNSTSYTGNKCVRLNNYGESGQVTDELISSNIDLSGYTSSDKVTLSFRYAYRKKASGNNEYLRVFASKDCGKTWSNRKTFAGSTLSSLTSSSNWIPSSQSDWETVHVTSITSSFFVETLRYKFGFESDGGNNLYIDDINFYEGDPSESIVTAGLEENASLSRLNLYPNPTEGEINLRFTSQNNENVTLEIIDITGKKLQNHLIKANPGSNLVMMQTEGLKQGVYFVNIIAGNSIQTLQFIVQ